MTSTTPTAFRHAPLTLSSSSIRLVQIHPVPLGTTSTLANPYPLALRISQFTTTSRPPYLAVSYTWGTSSSTGTSPTPTAHQRITINSKPFLIQPNLHSLLLHLRQRNERRFLWVDALCIDQRNLEERNFHVQLMARIYEEALAGLVWLGNPSAGRWEARAMGFVVEMARAVDGDAAKGGRKPGTGRWDAAKCMPCESEDDAEVGESGEVLYRN